MFTATYDVEGNMLTKSYPNGMTATYTYNSTGEPTTLEYKKTTDCTEEKEKCVWFKDAVSPSIHGQWLEQTSTLSHQAYTYDAAGRLTQVQNTPAGGKCTTRIYAYEEETNRTSLTTREPNSKGECATEGGTVEKHTYDEADRLTDTGIKYNEFGDITALPAIDAGGKEPSEELTSSYYTDNQLDTQTQNGETIGYNLDPVGRTRETVSTGKTTQDIIDHYAAGGGAPAWTIETPSGNWTRNIQGIGGGLAAIQVNGATPVLQLTDLHGDIIATAALSETETKLLTMTDTSEYGVPTTSTPAKYSWLGAEQQPTELPSGVIAMGARSYVPQLGRFLQPDPRPGGSANAYSYTFGDPINTSDPSGEFTIAVPSWLISFETKRAYRLTEEAEAAARRAAEEAAAREAAERAAEAAKAAAFMEAALHQGAAGASGGPEEPLGGSEGWAAEYAAATGQTEEEGEYEYATYHHGAKPESQEAHLEPALLLQPLTSEEAAAGNESSTALGSAIPLCRAGSEGPCARLARGGEGTCKSCRRRQRSAKVNVRIRSANGSWTKVFDTYCGIVGGAALTPGVDVFGAPAEVGCAGYGA